MTEGADQCKASCKALKRSLAQLRSKKKAREKRRSGISGWTPLDSRAQIRTQKRDASLRGEESNTLPYFTQDRPVNMGHGSFMGQRVETLFAEVCTASACPELQRQPNATRYGS